MAKTEQEPVTWHCKYMLARLGCRLASFGDRKSLPATGPVPCCAPIEVHRYCKYKLEEKK